MSKAIIRQLENKIETLETELEAISDPEITAEKIIESLGGHPIAGVKVVNRNYRPYHRAKEFEYRPGNTLTAPDWKAEPCCGNGLHYSPTITLAHSYVSGEYRNLRAVIVESTGDNIVIDDTKSKAETLRVVSEIDLSGMNGGETIRREIANIRSSIYDYERANARYAEWKKANV